METDPKEKAKLDLQKINTCNLLRLDKILEKHKLSEIMSNLPVSTWLRLIAKEYYKRAGISF